VQRVTGSLGEPAPRNSSAPYGPSASGGGNRKGRGGKVRREAAEALEAEKLLVKGE
jgi:hypothetical protein